MNDIEEYIEVLVFLWDWALILYFFFFGGVISDHFEWLPTSFQFLCSLPNPRLFLSFLWWPFYLGVKPPWTILNNWIPPSGQDRELMGWIPDLTNSSNWVLIWRWSGTVDVKNESLAIGKTRWCEGNSAGLGGQTVPDEMLRASDDTLQDTITLSQDASGNGIAFSIQQRRKKPRKSG